MHIFYIKILKEKFNKNIYFVFTGSKKENFKKSPQ